MANSSRPPNSYLRHALPEPSTTVVVWRIWRDAVISGNPPHRPPEQWRAVASRAEAEDLRHYLRRQHGEQCIVGILTRASFRPRTLSCACLAAAATAAGMRATP